MNTLLPFVSDASLLLGSLLLLTGALGFLRFSDFYARIHACGVTETLAASLILLALLLRSEEALPQVKLGLILLFILFSSPTASHALAKAAWNAGIRPRDNSGKRDIPVPPENQ